MSWARITSDHGGTGGSIEGFLNVPLSPIAAIRLVAWDEHKAGFIDVVPKSYTFPTSGITFSDAPFVKKDANYVDPAAAARRSSSI
jgi:iron complex outermembrane receptor protein